MSLKEEDVTRCGRETTQRGRGTQEKKERREGKDCRGGDKGKGRGGREEESGWRDDATERGNFRKSEEG